MMKHLHHSGLLFQQTEDIVEFSNNGLNDNKSEIECYCFRLLCWHRHDTPVRFPTGHGTHVITHATSG